VPHVLLIQSALTFQPHDHVLELQRLQVRTLLLGRQGVEVVSLHVQQVLGMLSDHINVAAPCEISKVHAQSVGTDGLNYLLAVHALKEPHFLLVGRPLAIFASLVRLLASDVEGPKTDLVDVYSREE
jgi:hypothetical protein